MSTTDHPAPGPDEPAGGTEPDPAAAPSRARTARYGCWPWVAGAALAATQLALVAAASGAWRTVGAVVLAGVTLLGIGFAAFGGGE